MKVYKLEDGIVVESDNDGLFYFFYQSNWDDFVNRDDLYYWIKEQIKLQQPLDKHGFQSKKCLHRFKIKRFGRQVSPICSENHVLSKGCCNLICSFIQ